MWRKVYALVLPVWVLVWVFRWSDLENFLWQVLHWKGFTPEKTPKKKSLFLYPSAFWKGEWNQLFLNFLKSGFFVLVTVTAPPSLVPTQSRKPQMSCHPFATSSPMSGPVAPNSTSRNKHPLTPVHWGASANFLNPDPVAWLYQHCVQANVTWEEQRCRDVF